MVLRRIETTRGHRYTLDGKPVPGVTTLLSKGLPKPAIPAWAARTCGEYVADNLDVLNALPDRESIIATVKQSPWSQRDRAAARGTDIHAIAERLIRGDDAPDVPDEWLGAVDGYVRFLDQWQPKAILTERPIGNRHWHYAGTFDAVFELPNGDRVLADWKTSKGVYGEVALQLAAYQHAEFYIDTDGAEQPMPEVDWLGVLHVTPTGSDLYRVKDADAAWKDFLHVAWTANAEQRIKEQITEPLEPGDAA